MTRNFITAKDQLREALTPKENNSSDKEWKSEEEAEAFLYALDRFDIEINRIGQRVRALIAKSKNIRSDVELAGTERCMRALVAINKNIEYEQNDLRKISLALVLMKRGAQ